MAKITIFIIYRAVFSSGTAANLDEIVDFGRGRELRDALADRVRAKRKSYSF